MINSNPTYFPKSTRVMDEITKIGSKAAKELYCVKDLTLYLNEVFQKEYNEYRSKELFFPGCPFKIYQNHYQNRLKEYGQILPDSDEFDFLKDEDALFWQLAGMDIDSKNNFYPFYPHLYPDPHKKNIGFSILKMHDFIDNRIRELGHYFDGPAGLDPIDYDRVPRSALELQRNPNVKNPEIVLDKNEELKPIPKDAKIFNTVWEAVLFHSVLVSYSGKYSRTKKEIPDLVENMLFPDGKSISEHTFYQKLQLITNASKGISHPKHGKYTENDYIAVEDRLLKEKPEAISKLKEKYFHNELY